MLSKESLGSWTRISSAFWTNESLTNIIKLKLLVLQRYQKVMEIKRHKLTGGHGPDPLADMEAASQKNPLAHGWAYNAVYPPSLSESAIESPRTSL